MLDGVAGLLLLLIIPVLLIDFCKRSESWGDVAVSDNDVVTNEDVDEGKSDASTESPEGSLGAAPSFSWGGLDGKFAMATREDSFICLRLRVFGLLLLFRLYELGVAVLPGRDNKRGDIQHFKGKVHVWKVRFGEQLIV